MRAEFAFLPALLLTAVPQYALAQSAAARPSATESVPEEISLVVEDQHSVYRQSGTSLRLYTHNADSLGASTCNDGCASAWPPVYARADAHPLGDWTVVVRADGRRQWALKGKPVYVRFHDDPSHPSGAVIPGWSILPFMPKP